MVPDTATIFALHTKELLQKQCVTNFVAANMYKANLAAPLHKFIRTLKMGRWYVFQAPPAK